MILLTTMSFNRRSSSEAFEEDLDVLVRWANDFSRSMSFKTLKYCKSTLSNLSFTKSHETEQFKRLGVVITNNFD